MIVHPKKDLKGLSEIFNTIADKMGISITSSEVRPCENIFTTQVPPEKAQIAVLEEV